VGLNVGRLNTNAVIIDVKIITVSFNSKCLLAYSFTFVCNVLLKVKKSYFSSSAAFDLYVTAPENDGSGLQYSRAVQLQTTGGRIVT
jgi:hypothetical protein